MIRQNLILFFSLLVCFSAAGQQAGRISGRVVSEEMEPIEGAVVVMTSLPDSLYVGSAATDSIGAFSLPSVPVKKYLISAKQIGFKDVSKEAEDGAMIELILSAETQQLKEVTVTAKPVMKQEAGKFVFMPGELTKMSRNGLDLVGLTPMLSSSSNSITILGMGEPIIYINGKEPPGGNEAAKQQLLSLAPQNIKRIEVITTPTGKQALGDNRGIVNVIIDNPAIGYIGFVQSSTTTNFHGSNYESFTSWNTYSGEKLKATFFLLEMPYTFVNHVSYKYNLTNSAERREKRYVKRTYFGTPFNFGLSFDFSPKSQIGLWTTVNWNRDKTLYKSTTMSESNGVINESVSITNTKSPRSLSITSLLYYTLTTDDKGSNLDVRTALINVDQRLGTRLDDGNTILNNNRKNIHNKSIEAKADYTHYFSKQALLASGVQFNKTSLSTDLIDIANEINSNRFKIDENIASVYTNYTQQIGSRFQMNLTLRYEHLFLKGSAKSPYTDTNTADLNFKKVRNHLGSSVSLIYYIPKGDQTIGLNFSRDFDKPAYSSYNPFPWWSSDHSYTVGNPDLEYTDFFSYRIDYSFLNKFIFKLSHQYSPKTPNNFTYVDNNGYIVSTYGNFGRFRTYKLSMNYYSMIGKRVYLNLYTLGQWANYSCVKDDVDYGYKFWLWDFDVNSRITVDSKKQIFSNIGFSTNSPGRGTARRFGWNASFNFNISKSFSSGFYTELSFKQSLLPSFEVYNNKDYNYRRTVHKNRTSLQFTVRYNFGKQTVKGVSQKKADSESRFN